jgi:hypothetical protein
MQQGLLTKYPRPLQANISFFPVYWADRKKHFYMLSPQNKHREAFAFGFPIRSACTEKPVVHHLLFHSLLGAGQLFYGFHGSHNRSVSNKRRGKRQHSMQPEKPDDRTDPTAAVNNVRRFFHEAAGRLSLISRL